MSGYATAPSVSASHRSRGCHQRRPRGGSMGDCQRHLSRHRWSQDTWQHLLVPAEEGNYFEQFHSDKIITRMLSSLADPYTRFLSPREFSMMARYDMTGVGINLKEVPDENGDLRLEVLGIILDGPAHSAGVRQILVNDKTASASKIVASALHDNCRAVLVGKRTYGKGLIQSVFDLDDGSGVVSTVGKYVTPNHKEITAME
ncbi:carboxyl-terminal-processing peptidase 1, chloroplastic-like isoform X2 [Glycine soja]|uniref:carboxyl-terminal-processing peptidase 1, chloroplastic-like isoform X2 n=1 Tax=Glycine soja TaxID=3848 RepID=UPI0010388B78|nr:carboxyl-terminal-processing peptidase 1, chloroplastic-like isoform X2 [Glycine soja]